MMTTRMQRLNPDGWPALALDIGGTWCRAAVVGEDGTLLARAKSRTFPERSGPEIVEDCRSLIAKVAAEVGIGITDVGVSVTGPVNPQSGVIYSPPNAQGGLAGLPLRTELSRRLDGAQVLVVKDTNAAALAEQQFGVARGVRDFVYLTISTGIGGAAVIQDRLILGVDGCAGEIGHVSVDPNGPVCGCGRRGCLESIASGPALARRYSAARGAGTIDNASVSASASGNLEGVDVSRAANEGDAVALEILDSARAAIASAAVDIANLYNPALIVIGGSVARANPEWLTSAGDAVDRLALSPTRETTQVVASGLDDDAGLLGAALILQSGAAQTAHGTRIGGEN
ncbi:MAG: ROK family protein [Cryobacterium sp.]|nr:ROK family protein [Cryobacterium sp.]MBX3309881.1 ROK family protein [Cryobacterium sp.]